MGCLITARLLVLVRLGLMVQVDQRPSRAQVLAKGKMLARGERRSLPNRQVMGWLEGLLGPVLFLQWMLQERCGSLGTDAL